MGFLSGLGQPSQTTGLNFMNKLGMAAATLNPMNPMSGEYIKSMQIRGQQALAAKGRNQTIEMLKRKAQQGDAVAGQIAAGIESGGISAKDGMDAYYKYTLTPKKQASKIEAYEYAKNTLNMSHEDALAWSRSASTVSVGGQETAYDKGMGEFYAEQEQGMMTEVQQALEIKRVVEIQKNLMSDPSFQSGKGQELFDSAKNFLSRLGIGEADIASNTAFQAYSKNAILEALGGSLGVGVSNADVSFLKDTVATLDNTGASIELMLNLQEKVADRKIQIAQVAREWKKQTGNRYLNEDWQAYLAEWATNNPLFPSAEELLNR